MKEQKPGSLGPVITQATQKPWALSTEGSDQRQELQG